MILPDGYSDVPAAKIAAVVTHLEMTQRPALPPDAQSAWTLRKIDKPAIEWFRELYRRVGEEWLWFSRIRMTDEKLASIIRPYRQTDRKRRRPLADEPRAGGGMVATCEAGVAAYLQL